MANNTKRRKIRKVNWYYDVRLYLPIFIIISAILLSGNKSKETSIAPTLEEISALSDNENIYEREPSEEEREIIELARLADCVGAGRSTEVKKAIMWVVINRTEDRSNGYGLSLIGEIERPKQWQQYRKDASYLESTYRLATEVYTTWKRGGARLMMGDMLWFVLNNDGSITVRNQFKEGKNRSEMTFGQ